MASPIAQTGRRPHCRRPSLRPRLERCNELGRRWGCARQRAQLCLRKRRAYQAPSDAGNHLFEKQGEHELGRIDSKVVEPTELTQAVG